MSSARIAEKKAPRFGTTLLQLDDSSISRAENLLRITSLALLA
tara:strand:+ start:1764 stop:1892 length:129 start_codon:yes stop_codon:yes gene_type:complete